MSTFDSEAQVGYSKQDRPFVRVSQNGQLLPETKRVIAVIARQNLVLATGHPTAEEALMMIREGKEQGVKHMVVTHAMLQPIHMSDAQMLEAAKMGAYIEFVYNGLVGSYKEFTFKDYARAIRYVGVEHCILSSDMGQPANPLHPDGLILLFQGLKEQGITTAEINRMAKENPARLLGLE
jgi:microsomal dipeptidase-like Zn-dependent dipeptidase